MKLCKLKLKNLNSFRRDIELDFEKSPLGDASLVAITGPTGAGKTTLLDAICVALYGKTPRLSGNKNQHPRHLISHGEEEGFAEVRFEANGTRFHATWSIKRKGSPKWQLFDDSGKLIGPKVAQEVESILGLDFGAFRRSVMLAQGEFAAFLKANSEDRRKILEATAGIGIYEILKDTLNDKVKEVEAVYADILADIEKIPPASPEQLKAAEAELDRLKSEANTLETQSQEVQQERGRETKRNEDYEKLQTSEKRQTELTNQQSEINELQAELENAQRAERLRPEKQTYDATKSDLEKAENALDTATVEKTGAAEQVKTDQTDFDEKAEAYRTASTEHKQKTDIYTNAKLDVARAADQLAEAEKRTLRLTDLNNQINTLSNQLNNKKVEQVQLQKQLTKAQTFLDENPLPTDRQHRLNRTNILLTQLGSQQKQLETALANEVKHGEEVASLKNKIKELSKTREERLIEKTNVKSELEMATTELNKLLAVGNREEWITQKQQASEAHPIAQNYETATDDLTDTEDRLRKLNQEKAGQDTELKQIKAKLVNQTKVCQHAEKAVEHCEAARELALLANPINQLRQRLQPGEPCQVCGSTEHSFFHIAESEDDEVLRNAEGALAHAKTELQIAQNQMRTLNTKQTEIQRDTRNTANQIENCESEIETLQDEKAGHLAAWQEIYPDDDVSSDWAAAQIEEADTAIAALAEAEQAQTAASHAYDIVAQQLETCETDITREEKSLEDIEKQLQDAINAVADLQADIASTEEQFWEFLPEGFHGVDPDIAVNQFSKKIKTVEAQETTLDGTQNQLNLLNTKIEADQNNLTNLQQDRADLQSERDKYQCEGEELLDTVRKKTDGLETENEIDAAVKQLEADLKSKEKARDKANNQVQESQKLLTQKQTTHENADERYAECKQKFETAQKTYFNKLKESDFDSPEAHDDAFRDETQIQEITNQVDAFEGEKQQLALEITQLKTRFEETPYDPEALESVETKLEEIGKQLQEKQQEVGAQQQRIDHLKDALKKREALGSEVEKAEAELMRWKKLQDVIPKNDLRDFALEIMFKQMGNLANVQLAYLTSERYQLKVESIGDLTVIDRWNANEERPVETLSGGESFLTSLALALALADLSRGRAELHSLFLDEGFGTLDADTLDTAIAALEGLRMQGRSIFLISHVQELTRRIPVKINVRKRGDGSSSVQVQG